MKRMLVPVALIIAAALAAGATPLHEDQPNNLAFDYEYGSRASTEPGFAEAAHVVRVEVHAQRIAGNPMEPKSCIAAYDAAEVDLNTAIAGFDQAKATALAAKA